jgi:gamma-F420-2:alpha-L-glutamate ligase
VPLPYEFERLRAEAARVGLDLAVHQADRFDLEVATSRAPGILLDGRPVDLPDLAICRLGAAITSRGLAIVRHLELHGVPVINPSPAIVAARDKFRTLQILAAHGLPVPRTLQLAPPYRVELVAALLGFPVVVKTRSGSRGTGVNLARTEAELGDLLDFLEANRASSPLLFQAFLKESAGRDLRVFVVGGRVLACMERASAGGFRSNVSRGGAGRPHAITADIEALALATAGHLGLDVTGLDLLFGPNGFVVNEANSAPQFQGLESCHPDVNVARAILEAALAEVRPRSC